MYFANNLSNKIFSQLLKTSKLIFQLWRLRVVMSLAGSGVATFLTERIIGATQSSPTLPSEKTANRSGVTHPPGRIGYSPGLHHVTWAPPGAWRCWGLRAI